MAKAKQVKKPSKGELLVTELAQIAGTAGVVQESTLAAVSKKLVTYVKGLERKAAELKALQTAKVP